MKIEIGELKKTFKLSTGDFNAIDGISMTVHEGERVGIIGRNGSGKSTLLSIIAGLQEKTSGSLLVSGHVDCIMAMGSGVRPDATGRENIYIDGELKGKTKEEIDAVVEQIIEYSELGEFIDQSVGTYSTGMKSRLAFSLMIFIQPEILIIDEALSAGDAQFGAKATRTMKEICHKGKILLLVSHSMDAVKSMCNRVLWLDEGKIRDDGVPESVVAKYLEYIREEEEREIGERFNHAFVNRTYLEGFQIEEIFSKSSDNVSKRIFLLGEDIAWEFSIQSELLLKDLEFCAFLEKSDGNIIWESSIVDCDIDAAGFCGKGRFELALYEIGLGADVYELILKVNARVDDLGPVRLIGQASSIFKIQQFDLPYNSVWHGDTEWKVEKIK